MHPAALAEDRAFGDEFILARFHHLQVATSDGFHFLRIDVEVGVGFPKNILHRRPVGIGYRLVGEDEAALAVTDEEEIGVEVESLTQQGVTRLERPLRGHVSGKAAIAVDAPAGIDHRAAGDVEQDLAAIFGDVPGFDLELTPFGEQRADFFNHTARGLILRRSIGRQEIEERALQHFGRGIA